MELSSSSVSNNNNNDDSLIKGTSSSYLTLYATMVTGFVVDMPPVPSVSVQNLPVTLFYDRSRIVQARNEFQCIVDRVAVLTHATAYCARSPSLSADKRRAALSSLSLFLVGDMYPDLDVEEAVALFADALLCGGVVGNNDGISISSNSIITGALKKGVSKDDPVRRLM